MEQTPGAKMMYPIRRKAATSREELVAHWFANHMPAVIASQEAGAAKGRLHASRYIATPSHGWRPSRSASNSVAM